MRNKESTLAGLNRSFLSGLESFFIDVHTFRPCKLRTLCSRQPLTLTQIYLNVVDGIRQHKVGND